MTLSPDQGYSDVLIVGLKIFYFDKPDVKGTCLNILDGGKPMMHEAYPIYGRIETLLVTKHS